MAQPITMQSFRSALWGAIEDLRAGKLGAKEANAIANLSKSMLHSVAIEMQARAELEGGRALPDGNLVLTGPVQDAPQLSALQSKVGFVPVGEEARCG